MPIIVNSGSSSGNANLLTIIQKVCLRIGIPQPTAAMGSTDQSIQQLVGICEEEGQDLATRTQWTALQGIATFNTVNTEYQCQVQTVAPGLDYIVNNTIWNRTLRRPVYGPKSQASWQEAKAMQINGPFNAFRVQNGNIYFYPAATAGNVCAFEYVSKNWIAGYSGNSSAVWTNDSDAPLLDDQLIVLGTIWRWKAAKGLDYAEDFAKYEKRVNDGIGRDGSKPILDMGGGIDSIVPGVFIQAGSFGL